MKSIVLANLRSSGGRLVAAGTAVAVSVAFLVTIFSLLGAATQTFTNQVAGDFEGADVIIERDTIVDGEAGEAAGKLNDEAAKFFAGQQGVERTQLVKFASGSARPAAAETTGGDADDFRILDYRSMPELRSLEFVDGRKAESKTEVVIDEATAERLHVGTGDSIEARDLDEKPVGTFTVSGVVKHTDSYQSAFTGPGGVERFASAEPEVLLLSLDSPTRAEAEKAPSEGGTNPVTERLATDWAKHIGTSAPADFQSEDAWVAAGGLKFQTTGQLIDATVKQLTGDSATLVAIVMGFGLMAVLVSGLVISNTFHVLVASRTRSLALLRAIGAARSQIRSSTLLEGAILGAVGAAAGIVLGWLLAVAFSQLARVFFMPTFAIAQLPGYAIAIGLAVGIAMATAASFGPALKATRVSPIAALAPVDIAAPNARMPWVRLVLGTVAAVAGIAITVYGGVEHSIPIAVAGVILVFSGVLLLTRVIVPPLVRLMGLGLYAVTGRRPSIKLVADNVRMAPRRTASTTTALLVGVTLVCTMLTGAHMVKATLNAELAERAAVDATVTAQAGANSDGIAHALSDSGVVSESVLLPGVEAEIRGIGGQPLKTRVLAATSEAVGTVVRSQGVAPEPGKLYVSDTWETTNLDGMDGKRVKLAAGGKTVELTLTMVANLPYGTATANPQDIQELSPDADHGATWLRISDEISPNQLTDLATALQGHGAELNADGAASRAEYSTILNTMLTITLVLLAAAVIIAIVGVGNTLSLSVIERRKETALLRALGMPRAAVAGMVTLESVLMAVVAVILGTVLGGFFGWAGISSLFDFDDVQVPLSFPLLQFAFVGLAAVVAASLASILPVRTVTKTQPAEVIG